MSYNGQVVKDGAYLALDVRGIQFANGVSNKLPIVQLSLNGDDVIAVLYEGGGSYWSGYGETGYAKACYHVGVLTIEEVKNSIVQPTRRYTRAHFEQICEFPVAKKSWDIPLWGWVESHSNYKHLLVGGE